MVRRIGPIDDQPNVNDKKEPAHSAPAAGVTESAPVTPAAVEQPAKRRRVHWAFPLGIGLAGLASAAAVLLRGCWHRNMSWPVRLSEEHGDFSCQTCNDCGIMRLFDERSFRGYGPYGYDLHELIARDRASHIRQIKKHPREA